jgi:type I restriction enzyme S subunit
MKRSAAPERPMERGGRGEAHGDPPLVPLSALCVPRTGVRDPADLPDEPFTYVDISAVDNRAKRITAPQTLIGKAAPSRARKVIRAGDVLVATTRPNLNAVAMVPGDLDDQICSTGFCVLRAGPRIHPHYLFRFVQSPAFVQPLSDLVKGALYPAVNDSQVLALEIPLPPLAEQDRIAGRLTAQLGAVERACAAARARLAAVQAWPAALLREALRSHPVDLRPAGECLQEVTQRIGESWKGRPVYGATRAGIAPAKERMGKHPERYKPVEQGTVFYNPMRILLGSIALLDDPDAPGVTSPDYVVLRGRPGVMDHRIFYYWLRSPDGERLIRDLARGGVRERILFRRLAKGMLPVLPWPVQQNIANRLAELPRVVASVRAELAAIDALPAALLRGAFHGIEHPGD